MTNYNRQMFTISDFGFSRFRIWDFGLWILKKEKSLILTLEPYVLHPKSFCPIKNKNIILSQIRNPKSQIPNPYPFFSNSSRILSRIPLMKAPDSSVPNFFPTSTASLMDTLGGISSQ